MTHKDRDISRREALKRTATIAAAAGLAACDLTTTGTKGGKAPKKIAVKPERMPVVYLPHGGGPWPFIDTSSFGDKNMYDRLSIYLKALNIAPPKAPSAILVVSAHWEAPVPTVMASPNPPMLYDYSGFPPESYEVVWPAPGAPALAGEIQSLLENANIKSGRDETRGFDHGTFVPLSLTWPKAEIPTLQLSLKKGLDPAEHIQIGRALEPLRDRGVFIIGSGMSYHNMRGFFAQMRGGPPPTDTSKAFDDWLAESMTLPADRRESQLAGWDKAPAARACHPREEHLLPLHVIAGAAGNDAGTTPFRDTLMGAHVSAVHFG